MENSENQNPENEEGTVRNTYISAEEIIAKMKVAFTNAKETEILSKLQTVGIDQNMLDNHLTDIDHLELLSQQQIKEYGEQYQETNLFNKKRAEIDSIYALHRNLAKVAFKNNRQAYTTLGMDVGRKRAYPAWYQQVKNFYAQLLANPSFKADAEKINIKDPDITAMQTALQEVSALKESQKKEFGEAQKATDTRDAAIDLLYPKYKEFIAYAKALFPQDQTLEKLGIIVKKA